jgi:hypothetical protein
MIFWSWQSDTPGKTGRHLVRAALTDAIEKLRQAPDVAEAVRSAIRVDYDIQGNTGSPDLARTIFGKIDKSEVVVADVTIVGETPDHDKLINSNVGIELGYALHARTDNNVLLVFNEHYGTYTDLPFDLRHKGGAIVFNLAPESERTEIEAQRKILKDKFTLALKPFLVAKPAAKQPLSLKANITYRRLQVPGGGDDELYMLLVSVENDGELDATDFQLDVEIPAHFLDGGGHRLQVPSERSGFALFRITNRDVACQMEHLYPGKKTKDDLIYFNYVIRGVVKFQQAKLLQEKVTATVFSGNMKSKVTEISIAELMD